MGHGLIRLAFDGGPGVGLGHRRRMEALARALADHPRPDERTELVDLSLAERVDGDVVVVDSYRHRADGDRVSAPVRVAIDDLRRDLRVDLVVDPCDGDAAQLASPAGILRGFRYSLVDPRLARAPTSPVGGTVHRVLVTTGGADGSGIGARVASTLATRLHGPRIRLVVGPWSDARVPDAVEGVVAPDGLAAELAAADLVVCSAGVTLIESLALGRPTVAFATAGNQHRALLGCARAGAALAVGWELATKAAVGVAGDAPLRRRLSNAARALIDGRGAVRVAEALRALA